MRALLLLTIINLMLLHCSRPDQEGESYADSLTSKRSNILSGDSIRSIYQNRIKGQLELFPTDQIKEKGKLYPVDEAPLDTVFFVFREQLQDAVARKDIFFVMEKTAENVVINKQKSGLSAFAQYWGLTSQAATLASPLWKQLTYLLNSGGVFTQNTTQFHAPYFSATFPEDLPMKDRGVVTGAGVRMRSAPALNSQISTVVSYDIVWVLEETTDSTTIDEETFPWIKVKTQDEVEGFIWGKFIGRPEQQQLSFQKTPEGWKMVKLISPE